MHKEITVELPIIKMYRGFRRQLHQFIWQNVRQLEVKYEKS